MVSNITKNIALISIVGTVFDYLFTHMIFLKNSPDIIKYFITVKLIPSFIIIYLVYYLIKKYTNYNPWIVGVPLGILVFVTLVQTYYGIYPILMADGTSVKLTIEQSFKGGFIHHFFDYFAAFLLVNKFWRK